jgi:hypothetical protein
MWVRIFTGRATYGCNIYAWRQRHLRLQVPTAPAFRFYDEGKEQRLEALPSCAESQRLLDLVSSFPNGPPALLDWPESPERLGVDSVGSITQM